MGGVWGRLGPPLGAFGRLLVVFWTFKIELLSSIGPKWAPRELLDGFWVASGRFGRVWGGFVEKFGRILDILNTQWADFESAWHDLALLWQIL